MKLNVLASGWFVTVIVLPSERSIRSMCLPYSNHVIVHCDVQTMLDYNTPARYQCQIADIICKIRFKSLPCCLKMGLHTIILSITISTYLNSNQTAAQITCPNIRNVVSERKDEPKIQQFRAVRTAYQSHGGKLTNIIKYLAKTSPQLG